jgi:DNA polymerase III alpha subunit
MARVGWRWLKKGRSVRNKVGNWNGILRPYRAFGSYSFSKARAAAFAVITYWSAWLRCHYPLFFLAGLLRHQPMGFYPEHVVVSDAQQVGVKFLPVDLRYSVEQVTIETDAIRLGLSSVVHWITWASGANFSGTLPKRIAWRGDQKSCP